MDSQNRIAQTSMTPTVGRQSPKNDFGDVLSSTVVNALSTGGALASGLTSGSPVLSAAVSSLNAVVGTVTSGVTTARSPQVMSVGSGGTLASGKGDAWDLLRAQDSQSREYLALQNEMQRESREFNAISNVLKVRHDSAKAAINNIR